MRNLSVWIVAVIIALIVASLSMFTVDRRQNAIVFRLGEIVDVITEPGLYFKVPMVDNVKLFDTRILTFDTPEPARFITSEKKNVLVDYFVKWRIIDVKQYYLSVRGDESAAQTRLQQTMDAGLQAEFGKHTVHDVISTQRYEIMQTQLGRADLDARKIGVKVVDVRLKRVDFSPEISESVYRRMESERKRVANELRSTGAAEAEKIRADADKQREIIIAQAYSQAQTIKGEGDAKASAVYAKAFQQNPDFYAFYRSLDAYRQSFKNKNDMLVLEPNSEFFKYFKNPGKAAK